MVGQPSGKKSKPEHECAAPEQQAVDEEQLAKLEDVQGELEKLDEEASNEVLEVERKYNEIRRPIYDRRNKIIETIPDFWLTAFLSHPTLSDLITEADHEIFKYLHSLEVYDLKDVKLGYSIAFNFQPNPYFENSRLTKTLFIDNEGKTNFTGTDIKWKDGRHANRGCHLTSNIVIKNPTDQIILAMQLAIIKGTAQQEISSPKSTDNINWFRCLIHDSSQGTPTGTTNDKEGNKRPFAENSFFTWFNEEPIEDFLEVMNDEVASIIQEELWPNPLKYFTGEIDEVDDNGEDKDEDGENDGNATEDSEDDDE